MHYSFSVIGINKCKHYILLVFVFVDTTFGQLSIYRRGVGYNCDFVADAMAEVNIKDQSKMRKVKMNLEPNVR